MFKLLAYYFRNTILPTFLYNVLHNKLYTILSTFMYTVLYNILYSILYTLLYTALHSMMYTDASKNGFFSKGKQTPYLMYIVLNNVQQTVM